MDCKHLQRSGVASLRAEDAMFAFPSCSWSYLPADTEVGGWMRAPLGFSVRRRPKKPAAAPRIRGGPR